MEYGKTTENHGKLEIPTLGSEIWQGKLKKGENLEISTVGHGIWQKTENHRKCDIHTLGCEICRGKLKKVENLEMSTVGRGITARKLKIMENEKHPLDDLKNDEITKKREK